MVTPTVTANDSGESGDTPRDPAAPKRHRVRLPGRHTLLRLVASLAGGVLWYLSFPPRPLWWLAPIAFALLALAVHGRRAWAGLGYGFLYGLAFLVPLLHWTGLYVGVIAWWPLSAFEALVLGVGVAAITVVLPLRGGPVWAALLWIADEALRARAPFGGLPWGKVAFGQPDGTYVSLAALGGTPLVGFAVTLTGFGLAALVLALVAKPSRTVALVGAGLAVVLPIAASLAAWPLVGTDPNAGTAVVAAVQGNVPRLGLEFNAQRRAVLDDHVKETEKLAAQVAAGQKPQPNLVIWPENSSDIDPYANPDAYAEISQAAAEIKAPISVGAVVTSQGPQPKNTAILWQPGRGPVAQYVKRQLQPFGETMPARAFFAHFSPDVAKAGDFVAGTKPVVFPMGPAKVAIDTCYEVAFDSVVRASIPGSTLLAVPTNNATFGLSEMTYQQLAMDQERAVEHGRSVVVAATSGVSAIIEPNGRITQETGLFTPAALVATVPLRSTTTLSDQLGAWPEWVLVAGGLLALAFGIGTRTRRQNTDTTTATTD
ncbi:MAG TPA: apolipoprotein N-acyltransferase [Pseudonocardiaceae bacterium]|nr:apolipoprotein N-acyltransferase [Pseudonocardiaceae bacterium]